MGSIWCVEAEGKEVVAPPVNDFHIIVMPLGDQRHTFLMFSCAGSIENVHSDEERVFYVENKVQVVALGSVGSC